MSTIAQAQARPRSPSRRQLLIAGVLGLTAAVLVVLFLNSAENGSSGASVATTSIVVAVQDIPAGTKITETMLATRELPVSAIGEETFRDRSLAIGQVARYPVAKGEPLSSARLVEAPKVQSLSFQIPQGMRGMTIPVSTTNTPAALLAPGDFVDVIVSVDVAQLTGRPATAQSSGNDFKGAATILQNTQVLSVDRNYVDNGVVYDPSVRGLPPTEKDKVTFVTLAVTPEQAQLLWLAQDKGKLTLTLRAFGDANQVPLAPKVEPLGSLLP